MSLIFNLEEEAHKYNIIIHNEYDRNFEFWKWTGRFYDKKNVKKNS